MECVQEDKRIGILYVDDEEKSLKYFRKVFEEKIPIYTAQNAEEGYNVLEDNREHIGIIMADHRMPGDNGVQLLEKARRLSPPIVRILVTAYSSAETAIEAVNTGAVYKYITKPWNIPDLESILMQGLEFFSSHCMRDKRVKEKLALFQGMIVYERLMSFYILANGLSHYLNNALFSVNTLLNHWIPCMLEENDKYSFQDADFWTVQYPEVRKQLNTLYDLSFDLHNASIKPTGEFFCQVNIREMVSKAITLKKIFLKKNKITVDNQIPDSLPLMTVNQAQMGRLFEFLLDEELKQLREGGKVAFFAQLIDARDGIGMKSKPEIQIIMTDNASTGLQCAFGPVSNPFFIKKNDQDDLGFNLMACFFIVYHHGGIVTIENIKGKGNRITMTIPVDPLQDQQQYSNNPVNYS